ncbi:WASH complex subunit 4 [Cloeon dipterum]|uniref:WASH complex subunit 4 n=1 Tax=Cloeon dipterum TaxID=197152 RepID=UPI00321FD3CE
MFQKNSKIDMAGELQLKRFGRLLEEFCQQRQNLSSSTCVESRWAPVALSTAPSEQADLLHLLTSASRCSSFNKAAAAVSATVVAADQVHREATVLCQGLLFYGEGPMRDPSEGAAYVSRMLAPLQTLRVVVATAGRVLAAGLGHLEALATLTEAKGGLLFSSWTPELSLHQLVDSIAQVLFTLITIQEVMSSCTLLQTHWTVFKRTLKAAAQEADHLNNNKLNCLQAVVSELEKKLISGDVFKSSLRRAVDEAKPGLSSTTIEHLMRYVRVQVTELDMEVGNHECWLKASAVYVLAAHLGAAADRKTFKLVWEPYKKISAVNIMGTVLWLPEVFFSAYLPSGQQLLDKKSKASASGGRESQLQQRSQALPKDAHVYFFIVCDWLIQLDACMRRDTTQLKLDDLHTKCAILLQGLEFVQSMSQMVKTFFNLHAHLGVPIARSSVVNLCKLVELIKHIEGAYQVRSIAFAESLNHLIQHLTYQLLLIVASMKKNLPADNKRNSSARTEALAALQVMELCLQGPCSAERRLLVRTSFSWAAQLRSVSLEELNSFRSLLSKLDAMCELRERLRHSADCSFLYWHRVVLPIHFSRMLDNAADLARLKYLFAAFQDCSTAMENVKHLGSPSTLQSQFKNEMFAVLKLKLLDPLCQEIETDLRLRVHSHLQVPDGSRSNFQCMLQAMPLRFFDDLLSIPAYVEQYLSATFYNLTTVALHDWKAYGEMRVVALHRYGVSAVQDHLPSHTLEQGLDVLHVTRNLPAFVASHVYNLNNQVFVEKHSGNKYLNTIGVQHVANSVRTHGTGIINTTVNFTYQFLKKNFQSVSQFLFDARIKSRLMKDLRHFHETKEQSDQKYSFSRADKFNQGIRKLGVAPDGSSLLDQFRMLVTQIGNSMGYVRMMRSGSRLYISKAISFVPDLEDVVSFEKLASEEGLSELNLQAAKELDLVLNSLLSNFDKGIEYFQLLVDVFTSVSKDPKNSHLKLFHAIVPPLTINFVEHMVTCKDKLNKNLREGAAFTDDGFAMGVAYLLKVLELDSEFDSLHWFHSIKDRYESEKVELKEQTLNIKKGDEKLKQTLVLTEKRIETYQQEFELLFFNLSSARIFFKRYTEAIDAKPEADTPVN